jgi:hypothetical protein
MAGQHVIGHLWDFVERHVEIIDGQVYYKTRHNYRNRLVASLSDRFYIHPQTGILCAFEKAPRKRKRKQEQTDILNIDNYHQYHKINEIWYLITFEDFPPPPTDYVTDVLRGLIYRSVATYRGRKIYAASKQQCSKKEIRFIVNQLSKN